MLQLIRKPDRDCARASGSAACSTSVLQLIRKPDRDCEPLGLLAARHADPCYNSLENPIGIVTTYPYGDGTCPHLVLQLIRKPDRDCDI